MTRQEILFVCTGNVCRSPVAERLFRVHAGAALHATVAASSAGTGALVGAPLDPPSARALEALGGDPTGHSARQLVPAMVDIAALVLCATRAHRDEVLRLRPTAMRRAFVLKEFLRLAPGAPPGDLRSLAMHASGQRGLVATVAPTADDIADPFQDPYETALARAQEIDAAIAELVKLLSVR